MIGFIPPADSCSRAGCRQQATVRLNWSNPKIHRDGRTKTWLACPEHASYLEDFLRARNFPVSVTPHTPEGHVDE